MGLVVHLPERCPDLQRLCLQDLPLPAAQTEALLDALGGLPLLEALDLRVVPEEPKTAFHRSCGCDRVATGDFYKRGSVVLFLQAVFFNVNAFPMFRRSLASAERFFFDASARMLPALVRRLRRLRELQLPTLAPCALWPLLAPLRRLATLEVTLDSALPLPELLLKVVARCPDLQAGAKVRARGDKSRSAQI